MCAQQQTSVIRKKLFFVCVRILKSKVFVNSPVFPTFSAPITITLQAKSLEFLFVVDPILNRRFADMSAMDVKMLPEIRQYRRVLDTIRIRMLECLLLDHTVMIDKSRYETYN